MSAPTRPGIRPSTEALRAALERDLIEWADDVSLRLVWADLLQIDGDPLGRLIVLDHFGETHPSVRAEAEVLREQLRARLEIPDDREFTLRWERGFVHTLELRPRGGDLRRWAKRIHEALARPALRFLECLHVIVDDADASGWMGSILTSTSHSTLRELHVGSPPRLRERPSGTYERGREHRSHESSGESLSLGRFPRLRWASSGGELVRLACVEGTSETRKHYVERLARRPLTSRNRTSLIRAIWDRSSVVQAAAFKTIGELGPQAAFVLGDLELLLQAPFGSSDPRQAQALQALAAIGPLSAGALPGVIAGSLGLIVGRKAPRAGRSELPPFENEARCIAFLAWLCTLGRAGRPALKTVDQLLASKPNTITAEMRSRAKSARKALLTE